MSNVLRLNRETGKYEAVFSVRVDAEIFRRRLFVYAERENIDVTDIQAWNKAIEHVARLDQWMNDSHAVICLETQELKQIVQVEKREERPVITVSHKVRQATQEHLSTLLSLARETPVAQWDSLLTPLPSDLPRGKSEEKERIYRIRYDERRALEHLKQEMQEPLDMERVALVASSVNGARIK